MSKNIKAGFTLIELLVVISIIGLLSSVVLASLSNARAKARDSAIITQVIQLRNIMALEYLDKGNYASLQKGWFLFSDEISNPPCNPTSPISSTYGAKVIEICNKIKGLTKTTGNRLYIGPVAPTVTSQSAQSFTIIALLTSYSVDTYICAGHNGKTSVGAYNNWLNPGCYADTTNTP